MIISISWDEIEYIVLTLSERVLRDGKPDVIIGIQRGGLIPSVILSHCLGTRDVFPFIVRRTAHDGVNAEKRPPRLGPNVSFTLVAHRDVLLVDDIVGSGTTLSTVQHSLATYSPLRVRSLACVVNYDNWNSMNKDEPADLITYIGKEVRGWVVFPWEKEQRYV